MGTTSSTLVVLSATSVFLYRRLTTWHVTEKSTSLIKTSSLTPTVFPTDAKLVIDGKEYSASRSVSLAAGRKHAVDVFRTGYRTKHFEKTVTDSWSFVLDPEPVHLQVILAQRSGQVFLDNKEVWNLQRGDLTDLEITPDKNQHKLAARTDSGELFTVEFRAQPGRIPEILGVSAPDLIVGASLDAKAVLFTGDARSTANLPDQESRAVSNNGAVFDFRTTDPDPAVFTIASHGKRRNFVISHGNAPVLAFALNATPSLTWATVTANIPGAHLFLEDKEMITSTPGRWHFQKKPGSYKYRLIAEGFKEITGTLELPKGKETALALQLESAPAELIIVGGTPGAELCVDGERKGELDSTGAIVLSGVPEGLHKIELRKRDYESVTLSKAIAAGKKLTLDRQEIELKPFGTLAFEVSPPDAMIQYRREGDSNSRVAEAREPVKVKAGNYKVDASATGYENGTLALQVAAGQTAKARLELKKKEAVLVQTKDYFRDPSAVEPVSKTDNSWLTGKNGDFVQLKSGNGFVMTFLKPNLIPRKHSRRIEFRISLYPTPAEITYEFDGQKLSRKFRPDTSGKSENHKTSAQDGDSMYTFLVTFEAHRVLLRNKVGSVLDEFTDVDHDWSAGNLSIKGDQYFVITCVQGSGPVCSTAH